MSRGGRRFLQTEGSFQGSQGALAPWPEFDLLGSDQKGNHWIHLKRAQASGGPRHCFLVLFRDRMWRPQGGQRAIHRRLARLGFNVSMAPQLLRSNNPPV